MDGAQIKELRARHKLTQQAMAELLGVTRDRVRALERGSQATEDEDALLAEWSDRPASDGDPPPPTLDELPVPPYDPGSDGEPEPEEEEPAAPKRRRRSGPRSKRLTGWQEETVLRLVALTQGSVEVLEVNEQRFEFRIPGLCDAIAQFDQFDAGVVSNGSPALWTALVKVAPRHPWLKGMLDLLTMGGDYNELTRAVLAIAVPILIHHGVIPVPGPRAAAAVENGRPPDEAAA